MKSRSTTDPSAIQYRNELHVFTVGADGNIQESLWLPGTPQWLPFQLTGAGGAVPLAPKAAGNVRPALVAGALHACYREVNNHIQDLVHAGGAWALVPVTGPGGAANAPAAAGAPAAVDFGGFFHCFFRDVAGNIWDATAAGPFWNLVKIGGAGGQVPGAMAAAGDPVVLVTENQTHVFYRGTDNHLWDLWSIAGGPWGATKISDDTLAGDPAVLPGKLLLSDPTREDTYHGPFVIYRDPNGLIRGQLYQGKSNWSRTDIIPGAVTISSHGSDDPGAWVPLVLNGPESGSKAPTAAGDPSFAFVLGCCYAACYRDASGNIVTVAIHAFSTSGGTNDNLATAMLGAYRTLMGLDPTGMLVPKLNIPASLNQKAETTLSQAQTKSRVADNSWYATTIGPSGTTRLPAAQGKPWVLPIGRDTVHVYYRDLADDIHVVAGHMEGAVGSTAAAVL